MFKVLQKLKWIKTDLKSLNNVELSSVEATNIKCHQDFLLAQNEFHADPTNSELATVEKLVSGKYKEAKANCMSFFSKSNC